MRKGLLANLLLHPKGHELSEAGEMSLEQHQRLHLLARKLHVIKCQCDCADQMQESSLFRMIHHTVENLFLKLLINRIRGRVYILAFLSCHLKLIENGFLNYKNNNFSLRGFIMDSIGILLN